MIETTAATRGVVEISSKVDTDSAFGSLRHRGSIFDSKHSGIWLQTQFERVSQLYFAPIFFAKSLAGDANGCLQIGNKALTL
jgi:hypothetical protein